MGKRQSLRPTWAPFSTLADENFYNCTYFVLNGESPNMSSPSSLPMVTSGLLQQVIKKTRKYYEFKDKNNVITLKAKLIYLLYKFCEGLKQICTFFHSCLFLNLTVNSALYLNSVFHFCQTCLIFHLLLFEESCWVLD